MKLVSWTLAGEGTAPIIGDALRSVCELVDTYLVVCTGPGYENHEPLVCAVNGAASAATGRMKCVYWRWRDDFGAGRNAGLSFAQEVGADWSLAVDADERVECPDPAAFRAWLEALPSSVRVVLVHVDGTHLRERIFRHPYRGGFTGRTHECFHVGPGEQATAPQELIRWAELPKSEAQMLAKRERDARLLAAQIAQDPECPRWHYYLGDALAGLGRPDEAMSAFIRCAMLRGWDEESAWACYRAAAIYGDIKGDHGASLSMCCLGLQRHAGVGELYWFAGLASYRLGQWSQAARWSRSALAHREGSASERERIGFRERKGLRDGPWEVLAFALEKMGDAEGAASAHARAAALRAGGA